MSLFLGQTLGRCTFAYNGCDCKKFCESSVGVELCTCGHVASSHQLHPRYSQVGETKGMVSETECSSCHGTGMRSRHCVYCSSGVWQDCMMCSGRGYQCGGFRDGKSCAYYKDLSGKCMGCKNQTWTCFYCQGDTKKCQECDGKRYIKDICTCVKSIK